MDDYEKVVEALKYCKDDSECGKCKYRTRMEFPHCLELLHNDAVTLIEKLQSEIDELSFQLYG